MEERPEDAFEAESDLAASRAKELTGLRERLAALPGPRDRGGRARQRLQGLNWPMRAGLSLLLVAGVMGVLTWAWPRRAPQDAAPAPPATTSAAPPLEKAPTPPADRAPASPKTAERPPVRPATPTGATSGARLPAAASPDVAASRSIRPPAPAERPVVRDEVVVAADRRGVEAAIGRYRDGFINLDAAAVHSVWPSANQKQLAREFEQLQEQRVEFHACDYDLKEAIAAVTCTGVAAYVAKTGDRNPRFDDRRWVFTLKRAGSDWVIHDVVIR